MLVLGGSGGSKKIRQRIATVLTRVAPTVVAGDIVVDVFIVGGKMHQYTVHSYEWPIGFPKPDIAARPIGEIYLNPDYIQAHDQNFDYLLIHGFLHCLGYDHVRENDRMKMEKREEELALLLS